MTLSNSTLTESLEVTVADDRMTACVYVDPHAAPSGVDLPTLLDALARAGISVDEALLKRMLNPVGRLVTRTPVIVARGTPPVDATAPVLELSTDLPALPETGPVPSTAKDATLGTLTGGLPPQDGLDVTGTPVRADVPPRDFALGHGVAESADGVVRSTLAGRPVLLAPPCGAPHTRGTLVVVPLTELPGDLTAAARLPDPACDLRVGGTVRELPALTVAGSLAVGGAVDIARLKVGEDLHIAGGLHGRLIVETTARKERESRGEVVVGRDVACKFASNALLRPGRDLAVAADLLHCEVIAGGRVAVGERVLGSRVTALGGIHCRSACNSNRAATTLDAGSDLHLHELADLLLPALTDKLVRLGHARATLAPLVEREQTLTPAQKLAAAKLSRDTRKLLADLRRKAAPLLHLHARVTAAARPEILIDDVLAEGVVIRLPGLEATAPAGVRGPVRLAPGRHEGEPVVLLTDLTTGATRPLPTRHTPDPLPAQLRKLSEALS